MEETNRTIFATLICIRKTKQKILSKIFLSLGVDTDSTGLFSLLMKLLNPLQNFAILLLHVSYIIMRKLSPERHILCVCSVLGHFRQNEVATIKIGTFLLKFDIMLYLGGHLTYPAQT
jgi:hypothetical protein